MEKDLFKRIGERIAQTARVETLYGEPRVVAGKTIIPVARVAYGFGAGESQGPGGVDEEGKTVGGYGGGGGVSAQPVGFILATEEGEVSFVSFEQKRKAAAAALVGFFFGICLARRLAGK